MIEFPIGQPSNVPVSCEKFLKILFVALDSDFLFSQTGRAPGQRFRFLLIMICEAGSPEQQTDRIVIYAIVLSTIVSESNRNRRVAKKDNRNLHNQKKSGLYGKGLFRAVFCDRLIRTKNRLTKRGIRKSKAEWVKFCLSISLSD